MMLLIVLGGVLFDPQYVVGCRYIRKERSNNEPDADYMQPFGRRISGPGARRTSGAGEGPEPNGQPHEI